MQAACCMQHIQRPWKSSGPSICAGGSPFAAQRHRRELSSRRPVSLHFLSFISQGSPALILRKARHLKYSRAGSGSYTEGNYCPLRYEGIWIDAFGRLGKHGFERIRKERSSVFSSPRIIRAARRSLSREPDVQSRNNL